MAGYWRRLCSGFVFFVLLVTACTATQQSAVRYDSSAENRFRHAVTLMEGGRYVEAADSFGALRSNRTLHQRTTASFVMEGQALLRAGRLKHAESVLSRFVEEHPTSEYRGVALYSTGVARARAGDYGGAGKHLVESIFFPSVKSRALALLDTLIRTRLSPEQTDSLLWRSRSRHPTGAVELLVAQAKFQEGNFSASAAILDSLLTRSPDDPTRKAALELREKARRGKRITIGISLPLMKGEAPSSVQSIALDMLDGIRFAYDSRADTFPEDIDVRLDVRDNLRDTAEANKILRDFGAQSHVIGVIGPVFSSTAFAGAPAANELKLPMISPTANAPSIAASGAYVFQLNPDLSMHGKALARYAVQHSGLRRIAVISPRDPSVKVVTEEFIRETFRLGGEILAVEFYSSGATDLSENMRALRKASLSGPPRLSFHHPLSDGVDEKLVSCGLTRSLIDSLRQIRAVVNVTDLLGPDGFFLADSLDLPLIHQRDDRLSAKAIEGIFAPVSSADEIGVVSSQLAFHDIDARLFGNGEWENGSRLEANRAYVDGVIFCSDTYIDRARTDVIRFGDGFAERVRKNPSRHTLFGFDAMNIVLHLILDGATSRDELATRLASGDAIEGLHTTYRLNPSRVNSTLHLFQYSNGEIHHIQSMIID